MSAPRFTTLGCRLNAYETEAMKATLKLSETIPYLAHKDLVALSRLVSRLVDETDMVARQLFVSGDQEAEKDSTGGQVGT